MNIKREIKNPFEMQKGVVAILCVVCTLFFMASGCEKHKPITQQEPPTLFPIGAKWLYANTAGGGGGIRYLVEFTVEKDTIVDGKNCRIIRGKNSRDIVYEDNGDVYYYFNDEFRKIYAYNVKVGDVVDFEFMTYSSNFHLDTTIILPFIIERISTILVNGVELKQICAYNTSECDASIYHHYVDILGFELTGGQSLVGIFPINPVHHYLGMYHTQLLWYQDRNFEFVNNIDDYFPDCWTVVFKLKSTVDEKYLATEDPKMKTLTSRHGVTLKMTPPCPYSERVIRYHLIGKGRNKEKVVKDFLTTGKFERDIDD